MFQILLRWEKQPHECSLSTPTLLHKNRLRTWNTFLPRDKESSQTTLDLAPVWEYISLSDSMCVPLFYYACMSYSTWPAPLLYLSPVGRRGIGSFILGQNYSALTSRVLLAISDQCPWLKLILPCLFSSWVKCHSFQYFTILCYSSATPIPRCSGQKCLVFCSWS